MERIVVVRGHLTSPTTIELEEPVDQAVRSVEVVLRITPHGQTEDNESVFDFLHHLPPGTRTKEDIDRQLQEARESWVDR